jgi:hypothetical protein
MQYYVRICPLKIATQKTQIVNGIQQICFSNAILSRDSHHRRIYGKLELRIVFKLEKLNGLKPHVFI